MAVEHTFVMVKPDGVRRAVVGEVVSRFERKGLKLEKMRMLDIDEDLAGRHYAEHVEKPFFGELVEFITSGPVVAMEWSGESAVSVARTLMGPTNPADRSAVPVRPVPHPASSITASAGIAARSNRAAWAGAR